MDLQGVFVKIRDVIKFKGFLVEFLEKRRSWENQEPPENRQKSGFFWASPFTMHLVWTLLNTHTHNFIFGELISQLHTHISYTTLIVEEFICVMRVCLCCLFVFSPTISEKGNYITIMLRELVSNYTHITYTTIIVGELIMKSFPLPWYSWPAPASHRNIVLQTVLKIWYPSQNGCIHDPTHVLTHEHMTHPCDDP